MPPPNLTTRLTELTGAANSRAIETLGRRARLELFPMGRIGFAALVALAVSTGTASASRVPFFVRPNTVAQALTSDGLHLVFGKRIVSTQIITASCSGRGHANAGRYKQFVCRIRTPDGTSSIEVHTFTRNVSNWFYTWSY